MPEEYLQVAFEIKAACDEISRRLLRWHWEQRPGSHTLEALVRHLTARRQESPLYYDRLPELERKTSWQQLDTTLCMRVLLDPEKDAAHPLDLLGNTPHPGAARRACNAIRTARNEAAHAADRTGGVQAALLFDEAIERLEEGYRGTAFSDKELEGYYRQAEEFRARCNAGRKSAPRSAPAQEAPEVKVYPTGAARQKAAAARAQKEQTAQSASRTSGRTSSSRSGKSSSAAKKAPAKTGQKGRPPKNKKGGNKVVLLLMLLALLVGLILRARAMGLF